MIFEKNIDCIDVIFPSFVETAEAVPPHLQLEFKCFLVDKKSGKHIPVSPTSHIQSNMYLIFRYVKYVGFTLIVSIETCKEV